MLYVVHSTSAYQHLTNKEIPAYCPGSLTSPLRVVSSCSRGGAKLCCHASPARSAAKPDSRCRSFSRQRNALVTVDEKSRFPTVFSAGLSKKVELPDLGLPAALAPAAPLEDYKPLPPLTLRRLIGNYAALSKLNLSVLMTLTATTSCVLRF